MFLLLFFLRHAFFCGARRDRFGPQIAFGFGSAAEPDLAGFG